MNRYLKIFAILGLLAFLSISGYMIFNVSPREFFHQGITFGYVNENIDKKDFGDFIEFLQSEGVEIEREEFEKVKKEIRSIYILEDESFVNPKRDPVMILEVGVKYFLYLMKIEKYFNPVENVYILKNEYKKKLGLGKYWNGELYMLPYRGNFMFSTNSRKIHKLIGDRTSVADNTAEFFEKKMGDNLGIAFFNLKKENAFGINTLSMVFNYENHMLNTISIIYLREMELKANEKRGKDSLTKYIGDNKLYLDIPEYIKVFEVGRRFLIKDKKMEFLLGFWQTVLGIDIPRLLGDIDREIIYDLETADGIVKFSETERIEKITKSIGKRAILGFDHKIELKGNKLFIGKNGDWEEQEKVLELPDNQIIYFNGNRDGEVLKIEAFNLQKIIKIYADFNDATLRKMIEKKFKKEGNEDDKDT